MENFVLVLVLAVTLTLVRANVDPCHCDTSFEPARCYKDRTDQRLLQNYILNERDPTLSNYRGKSIEWTNWQNYLPEFICRCANEAKLLGFDVFGIQFYGECWADKLSVLRQKGWISRELAEPSDCVDGQFQPCSNTRYCSGIRHRMMVYHIVDMCDIHIEKLGCYRMRFQSQPFLPEYVLNDRDPKVQKTWSGIRIDWPNWYKHLPDFVCRCAQRIKQKGYGWKIFGIRNWGECWSGNTTSDTFLLQMVANVGECKNQCFKDCKHDDPFCTGTDNSNAVYVIVDNSNEAGSG